MYPRLYVVLVTFYLFSQIVIAQNFNRPTPPNFPKYEFQRFDTTDLNGYYLFAPFRKDGASGWSKGLAIADQDGYLVWWTGGSKKMFDFKYNEKIGRYSYSRSYGGAMRHYFLDNNLNIIDTLTVPSSFNGDMHEVTILDNGNIAVIAVEHVVMDLSSYHFGGTQGSASTVVADFVLLEFDSLDNIVFEWKARNHLPIDIFIDSYGYNPNRFDYLHANAIEEDTDGNFLVSLRTADALCKIDRITGAVQWIAGGDYNQFTFINDNGFSGQHDIRRLPNGNISLFDNDFSGTNGARGIEYMVDTLSMTVSLVNDFSYLWSIHAKSMGGFRKLTNGHQIVGWGNTSRPNPSITLIDEFNNIAADFFFEDTIITYRAFFQELENLPSRPTITCSFDGTNDILTASPSNFYMWSNGETTPSIIVSDTGTYQVWVDQGMGMLGSAPYFVDNLQNHCIVSSISENLFIEKKTIISYYDFLGREIKTPRAGELYIVRYSDGSFEKVFNIIE